MQWNPADYAKHSDAQLKWAQQLRKTLNLRGDEAVLDVGCGDGKITADFAKTLPQGRVVGIDSSPEMIAYAARTYPAERYGNLTFVCGDARSLNCDREFDLCFSNAVLHWVDDRLAFFQGASRALRSGGRLAISCGGQGNAAEILQVFAALIVEEPWSQYFSTFANPYFFDGIEDCEQWLRATGFQVERLALVPKDMTHAGRAGLAAWIRTTWMPFISRVPAPQQSQFIEDFLDRYLALRPVDAEGLTHVGMVRLEVDALRQ